LAIAFLVARLHGDVALPTPTHRPHKRGVGKYEGDQEPPPWLSMADAIGRGMTHGPTRPSPPASPAAPTGRKDVSERCSHMTVGKWVGSPSPSGRFRRHWAAQIGAARCAWTATSCLPSLQRPGQWATAKYPGEAPTVSTRSPEFRTWPYDMARSSATAVA
jgi:hypothetical protein